MALIDIIEKGRCDWPARIAHHTLEVCLTFDVTQE